MERVAAGPSQARGRHRKRYPGGEAAGGWGEREGRVEGLRWAYTLMHAGAEGGSEQVVSMLMRAGAGKDINGQAPRSGLTPLHLAVMGGMLAAAKVLMLAGADVNKIDAEGVAPLHLALRHGHAELAQVLLLGGADSDKQLCNGDYPIHLNGDYPIHLVSRRGEDGVLRSLLHKGANANRHGRAGMTPLILALEANHISTVNILLAGGASARLGPTSKKPTTGIPLYACQPSPPAIPQPCLPS
ncbi:unnamed protein product [Ectocarpus fasciculatus]